MPSVLRKLAHVLSEPVPLRFLLLRFLDRRLDLVDYPTKLNIGSVDRSNYGFGLLAAARLAGTLGYPAISALEFGVAGGNGLVALERHAEAVRRETGVRVDVFGFDTGAGMPPPVDHRDLPYLVRPGRQRMDVTALQSRLAAARLVLGPIGETVPRFFADHAPPPVGFVAIDLGYHSSTVDALRLFDADPARFLPRVTCFFNCVAGPIEWGLSEFNGGHLALTEFNQGNRPVRIGKVNGLGHVMRHIPRLWHDQIYVAHLYAHPDYARPTGQEAELTLHPTRT